MKLLQYILLTHFLILSLMTAKAQDYQSDSNYKNLQNNIRNLEKATERNDLTGMERYLKYCKKFMDKLESAYSGVDLSAEKAKMQAASAKVNASNAEKDQLKAKVNAITQWKYPMEQLYTVSLNTQNMEEAWQKFQGFDRNQVLGQISSLPSEAQKGYVLEVKKLIENNEQLIQTYGTITQFDKSLTMIKGIQDENQIQPLLRRLEITGSGLQKINPNNASVNSKLAEVQGLQGNVKQILDAHKPIDRRKNAEQLPKAVQSNAALEESMVEAIKFQNFPGVSILRAILTDANWVDERNDLGVKIGRSIEAVIVMKNDKGECFFQYFDFRQPTNGTGYGKTMRKASGERYYIDCGKI